MKQINIEDGRHWEGARYLLKAQIIVPSSLALWDIFPLTWPFCQLLHACAVACSQTVNNVLQLSPISSATIAEIPASCFHVWYIFIPTGIASWNPRSGNGQLQGKKRPTCVCETCRSKKVSAWFFKKSFLMAVGEHLDCCRFNFIASIFIIRILMYLFNLCCLLL